MTTLFVYADGLYPKRLRRDSTKYDEYLKAHKDVDPAILAFNLNLTESFIRMRQRKLGLRKLTGNRPRRRL